jgi:hypothetical protein
VCTLNWSTSLHSVLRNASNKYHSITVEAELKFLFVLVFFSVLCVKVMIMRKERGMMRAEMSVAYCYNEYRKPLRDPANAPGEPLSARKVLCDCSAKTKSIKLILNTSVC